MQLPENTTYMSENKELSERLRENNPEFVRLDIGAKLLSSFDEYERTDFLNAMSQK